MHDSDEKGGAERPDCDRLLRAARRARMNIGAEKRKTPFA
jgi:hypothetical protein